jgi:hypothetical protein
VPHQRGVQPAASCEHTSAPPAPSINDGTLKISISYADLATSDRLAAQLLDADAAGELTLATRPKAAALVKLPRRLHAR